MKTRPNYRLKLAFSFAILAVLASSAVFCLTPSVTNAALLSVSPAGGTFTVGSTFDVSLYLNSEKKSINAIDISLSFPPQMLQLVSPSTGKSIIGIWVIQPNVNNETGRLDLKGGIPSGITTSSGLITTLTFRVKSVGKASMRFLDSSKVLLNDGFGTDDLNNTLNGVFDLVLPPPAGPEVISETHPNPAQWYANPNAVLKWVKEEAVEGYSYSISSEPTDIPDDIVDSAQESVTYRDLGDGIQYFHIKALRNGSWGGTTHFSLRVDTSPPAEFPVTVIPAARTTRSRPVVEFQTTDAYSGMDHYEIKFIPLNTGQEKSQPLFVEAVSPYVSQNLELGNYDIIVRAYDQASNVREVKQRLSIVTGTFKIIQENGLQFREGSILPWTYVWLALGLLVFLLFLLAWIIRRWHRKVEQRHVAQELPSEVGVMLNELNSYRQKYGKIAVVVLCILAGMWSAPRIHAQELGVAPPIINQLSTEITNQDIFYVGGKAPVDATVVLHIQNKQTGNVYSETVQADGSGEWFYRHNTFLPKGDYIVWAQAKSGNTQSVPSPQQLMHVTVSALQFGGSRLSLEIIYGALLALLGLVIIGLLLFIVFHSYHGRKKKKKLLENFRQAEESVRRGFAVLRRDLQAELEAMDHMHLKGKLSEEGRERQLHLMHDLEQVEKYIGREIWELEQEEQS